MGRGSGALKGLTQVVRTYYLDEIFKVENRCNSVMER